MDLTAAYCPIRRSLEELGWGLASRLASTTDLLMHLIGADHGAFLAARADCASIRFELSSVHRQLKRHRDMHHC